MTTPVGVSLQFPQRTLAGARVPMKVAMTADMAVYHAVNGILDRALEVVLVRRDRPGLRFLAKIDPRAYMRPEPPLPPPDPASAGVRVTEERTFDLLDYGATHYGGASYNVFATFASASTDVRPLLIEDRSHSHPFRPPEAAPPLPEDAEPPLPEPPRQSGLVAAVARRGGFRVEGALREAVRPPRFASEPPPAPFVTIVVAHLGPRGGARGGSFAVEAKVDGRDHVARFSIPIDRFAPPESSPCRAFLFSGDSPPVVRDFLWRKDA